MNCHSIDDSNKLLNIQDQHTEALGPNYEGCPCFTFDFGCCEDGLTIAKGPNKDECSGCQSSEFGCCEDGFTSAQGENMEGWMI